MNRRNFIIKSGLSSSIFSIVPSSVLGINGVSPNNKIQIGFIGAGRQGRGLMKNFTEYNECQIIAVSDVDSQKVDFFSEEFENKILKDNEKKVYIKKFEFYREMLQNTSVDAVVIATPDHWHAQMSVDSAKYGKDIYCEKPLSSTISEGRAMVNSARKYKVVYQTGSMQRSWKHFRHAAELIQNGYIGEIKEVNVAIGDPHKQCDLPSLKAPDHLNWNEWIGPVPYRGYHPDLACLLEDKRWGQWRNYKPFGGGMITDFGAHMFDIVQWALEMDNSGPKLFVPPKKNATLGLSYYYDNEVKVNHIKWGKGNNEIQFIGSEGKLEVSRRYLRTSPDKSLKDLIIPKNATKRVYQSDNHHLDWLNSIKNRTRPICDVEIGHRTASVCNICNIAYDLQRDLEWDAKKEIFVGDDSANLLIDRPYRGNWNYKEF